MLHWELRGLGRDPGNATLGASEGRTGAVPASG